jgi:hydrogenase small subunit
MKINRRNFFRLAAASSLGLSQPWLLKIFFPSKNPRPPVIWFQAQTCSGCLISLANSRAPLFAEILTEIISLQFIPTIMSSAGSHALRLLEKAHNEHRGEFLLLVEGSIPVKLQSASIIGEKEGKPMTALDWIKQLAPAAKAVLSIGTCSAFGGIPAAQPNPTGTQPLSSLIGSDNLINVPGCPPHPDWVSGTIAYLLQYGKPAVDSSRRPKSFFGQTVHDLCPRRGYFEIGAFAADYGEEGCFYQLGCKGPISACDIPLRGWNSGINSCIESGGICIGCTEPGFPDHSGDGLFSSISETQEPVTIAHSSIGTAHNG